MPSRSKPQPWSSIHQCLKSLDLWEEKQELRSRSSFRSGGKRKAKWRVRESLWIEVTGQKPLQGWYWYIHMDILKPAIKAKNRKTGLCSCEMMKCSRHQTEAGTFWWCFTLKVKGEAKHFPLSRKWKWNDCRKKISLQEKTLLEIYLEFYVLHPSMLFSVKGAGRKQHKCLGLPSSLWKFEKSRWSKTRANC